MGLGEHFESAHVEEVEIEENIFERASLKAKVILANGHIDIP